MKNRILGSILVIGLAYIGFNIVLPQTVDKCVTVYVDYGSLDNNKKLAECIEVFGSTNASDIMNKSGIILEGTARWGDEVVCRVNGLPDATRENCDDMPPENAYWAVIVKPKASATNLFPKWGWAQTGINDVYLSAGDSVGLVFSEDGKLRWPN